MLIPRTQKEVLRQRNQPAKSIDPIIEETHVKAKELQAVTSEVEAAKQIVRTSRAEHDRILRASKEANKKKEDDERASANARNSVSKLTEKKSILGANMEQKKNEVFLLEKEIEQYQADVVSGKKTLEDVKLALKDAFLELAGMTHHAETVKKIIADLKAEENEWRGKIKILEAKEAEIYENIEIALENFRVFEARINQFSKDTGYIVGYPRIESLK